MKKSLIQKVLFASMIGIQAPVLLARQADRDEAVTRTCPCAMVPFITEDTNVRKVIKTFTKSSPRGQRSQLEGFINQYVSDPSDITEEVLLACARVYSERTNNPTMQELAQELIKAKVKKPAQKKALLAIGKIIKSQKQQYCSIDSMAK